MRLKLEINRTVKVPIEDAFFKSVAKKTLLGLDFDFLLKKNIALSVAFVSPKTIQDLNKKYRRHDSVTDILSFPEYANVAKLKTSPDKEIFLGELILCYNDIQQYAKENRLDLKEELANVFAHGILHLLGKKHGPEMFSLQKKVAQVF